MKKTSIPTLLAAAALVLLCWAGPLTGQGTRGTITGVVKDSSGAVVPGADISIVEKATSVETKAVTTEAGVYRAPYLPPGRYRVSASKSGFKTAVRDNVDVLVTQTVTLDFSLDPGEISEQITVSAETPLLEASTPEIGTNLTEKEFRTLPILVGDGTRQLQDFVFRSLPGTSGGTFEGTINGGQAYSHEILIEGISIGRMDLNGGSNNEFTPTLDAVSEMKLQTGALSSQFGNTQTGLTNFGLKSGTNDFHGTAFWFHRNKALNANSWDNNRLGRRKSPFLDNNFGGTVGGPIKKDRTFFFVSYEGDRFNDQTISGFDSLPLPAYKQGDFSRLLSPAFTGDSRSGTVVGQDALGRNIVFGQIYDPMTARQLPNGAWVRDPFPGNIIPRDRFSRVTQNVLKHDVPNPLLDLFRNNNPRVGAGQPILNIDNVGVKVDHVINSSHKLSASYTENDRSRLRYNGAYRPAGIGIPGPAAVGDRTQATPGWIIRFAEDWTISPTMLNHFGFGFNRFRNANQSNSFIRDGRDWAAELGMVNVGKATFPIIRFAANNATLNHGTNNGQLGDGGTSNAPNGSTIVQNDFTWLRGKHSFRFGGEHRRYYLTTRSSQTTGTYNFHSENTSLPGFVNLTGFAYASFLLGEVQSTALGVPLLTPGIRSRSTAFYIQDDYKISSSFTLNLGLRWDIPQPLTEAANRMSGLDPTVPNPGADGYRGALVFLGDCQGCIGRNAFADTYYKQFAPRVGFAWAANEKTVIRGGYGINFAPPILDGFDFPYTAGFDGSNPIIARSRGRFVEEASYRWDTPYPPFTQQLPNTSPTQRNGIDIGWYRQELQRQPYVQNWNIGIQRELPWQVRLETNYVGNKGTRLNEDRYNGWINQLHPSYLSLGNSLLDNISLHPEIARPYPSFNGTVARALRPFPQFETVTTHKSNNGYSTYHSLQATVTKRTSSGLSFIAAYTFSKNLATSDSAGPGDYNYNQQDIYNRRADYGVTAFHIPHDFKLTWIYDAPFGKQGRWLRSGIGSKILGGWSMAGIQRYRSGPPLAIGTVVQEGQALFNPNLRADVFLPRDQQVLDENPGTVDPLRGTPYINPAAFGPPPRTNRNVPIRLGNAPRFLPNLRGFAIWSEDFSLIKRTDLGFHEGANIEFRCDIVNLFNRTRLSNPELNPNDPSRFGRVFGRSAAGPRQIQMGVRISF